MRGLADDGTTTMMVSHEMGFAREVADRVVVVDEGRIGETGDPTPFFENPETDRGAQFRSKLF